MNESSSTNGQDTSNAGLTQRGSRALQRFGDRLRDTGGDDVDRTLARALGWFSVGLGLAELFAPRQLGRAIGAGEPTGMLRFCGVRELGVGLAILGDTDPDPNWLTARVAGDALDLGLLAAAAFKARRAERQKLAFATAAVAGVTALDVLCAVRLNRQRSRDDRHLALAP